PEGIETVVSGNRIEPGGKLRLSFEVGEVPVGLDADLLRQVGRRLAVPRRRQAPVRHLYMVATEELVHVLFRPRLVRLSTVAGDKRFVGKVFPTHWRDYSNCPPGLDLLRDRSAACLNQRDLSWSTALASALLPGA